MGQIDYDQIYYLQGIVNQHSARSPLPNHGLLPSMKNWNVFVRPRSL